MRGWVMAAVEEEEPLLKNFDMNEVIFAFLIDFDFGF